MRYWQTLSAGRVIATEQDEFYVPYGWKFDQSKRVVIWNHGAGGTYECGPVEKALAEALGCVWINFTNGNGSSVLRSWGADFSLTGNVTAYTYAKTNFNVADDGMVIWGGSMGGLTAVLTAIEHPDDVAAIGCAIPALDPAYVRDNDPNETDLNKTAIEAFLLAQPEDPVPADKQAYLLGEEFAETEIPCHVWGSSNDQFTPSASTTQFVTDSGCGFTSLGAVGHSYTAIDFEEALEFLRPHVEAA